MTQMAAFCYSLREKWRLVAGEALSTDLGFGALKFTPEHFR